MLKTKFTTYPALFLLSTLLVVAQSCSKNIEEAEEVPVSEAHIAELKQFVANSTGMPASAVTYQAPSKTFIVDNDGLIALKDADTRFQSRTTTLGKSGVSGIAQRAYLYTVAPAKAPVLKIYADATVPAAWLTILDNALANWNSTSSQVYITRVTNTTTTTTTKKGRRTTTTQTPAADITVTTNYDNATSTIATANYPDAYGNPGKQVTINTYYTYLSDAQKLFALTHELGHTLGFTHTDGTYGSIITGTPATDPQSVMNSVCLSWMGFTPYDLMAVRTVYPK